MNNKIILYGTPTCSMVPPVRNLLRRASAEYTYVDISRNAEAKAIVENINNGNASVPTLLFHDGKTLTEPSPYQLQSELNARGYTVAKQTVGGHLALLFQTPAPVISGVSLLVTYIFIHDDIVLLLVGATLLFAFAYTRTFAQ